MGYIQPEGEGVPGRVALTRALPLLAHRGPDGEGLWLSPDRRVGLAHRRLAVIDPEGGAQPMVDPETGCVVVANGEIYNFGEILAGFEARGRATATRSDTEALLASFAWEGERCASRLRGMFAFAAHDPRTGHVLLARDRMGQKPLFHAPLPGGGAAFASELPALFALLGSRPEPDREALALYLSFGYVPAPWTVYRGIRKLPAGQVLRLPGGEPEPYWRRPEPGGAVDPIEAAERIRERVREAVRLRLVSDVPLGAFLSGGLDSATVVAFMAEEADRPVRTFTVRSPWPEYDETERARATAERFGTVHEEIDIETPDVEELPALLGRWGEPFGDSSAVATALISRAARKHLTVALTGDGGDEAFGGYDRFRILSRLGRVPRLAGRIASLLPGKAGRAGDLAAMEPWRRYYEFYEIFNGGLREELLAPDFRTEHGAAPRDFLRRLYGSFAGSETDRMLATDAATWLPDDLNPKVDVASMAVALECRSPLQDHVLVEECARLPATEHVRGRGKALLRRAVGDLLPEEVLSGPKRGFAAPVEHWLRGDLAGYLRARLTGPALASLELLRPEAVERVVASLAGGSPTGRPRIQVWVLLALALWAETL